MIHQRRLRPRRVQNGPAPPTFQGQKLFPATRQSASKLSYCHPAGSLYPPCAFDGNHRKTSLNWTALWRFSTAARLVSGDAIRVGTALVASKRLRLVAGRGPSGICGAGRRDAGRSDNDSNDKNFRPSSKQPLERERHKYVPDRMRIRSAWQLISFRRSSVVLSVTSRVARLLGRDLSFSAVTASRQHLLGNCQRSFKLPRRGHRKFPTPSFLLTTSRGVAVGMWESRALCEISKRLWKSICDFHGRVISIAFRNCFTSFPLGMLCPRWADDRRSWGRLYGRVSAGSVIDRGFRFHESRLQLLAQAIAVAFDVDRDGVVQHPVEDR